MFFWLKITDPIGATESSWSARLVIAIGVLSSLSILGFYLFQVKKTEISELEAKLAEERANSSLQVASISGELALLRQELVKAKQQEVLNASSSSDKKENSQEIIDLLNSLDVQKNIPTEAPKMTAIGKVKYTSTTASNVYELQDKNSKIIGVVEPGNTYDYFEYTGSWYLIELSEGRQGWVESDKVVLQP